MSKFEFPWQVTTLSVSGGITSIDAIASVREKWLSNETLLDSAARIRRKIHSQGLALDELDETIEEALLDEAIQGLRAGRQVSPNQLAEIMSFVRPARAVLLAHAEQRVTREINELGKQIRSTRS